MITSDIKGKKFQVKQDFKTKIYSTPSIIKKGEIWTAQFVQFPTHDDNKKYIVLLKGNDKIKVPELELSDKFKQIQTEMTMKFKNKLYLLENELSYSKEERKAFLESLKKFSSFKNEVYRSKTLREISQQLGELIESAEGFTLQETQDNFDKISVSRDLKEIKNDYNLFAKTCNEITTLQQRLEAVYENIGNKLGRYYDI